MMLNRVEIRKRIFNYVWYTLFARIQIVGGISSRLDDTYNRHRILWDLDGCTYEQAIKSLSDVQDKYNLGKIFIISDKDKSYGGICNTVVPFKELLHILIDTDFVDVLYVRYTLIRHEAILRLSDKEGRKIHREVLLELNNYSDRIITNDNFCLVEYETGYSRFGLKRGDFSNEQRDI